MVGTALSFNSKDVNQKITNEPLSVSHKKFITIKRYCCKLCRLRIKAPISQFCGRQRQSSKRPTYFWFSSKSGFSHTRLSSEAVWTELGHHDMQCGRTGLADCSFHETYSVHPQFSNEVPSPPISNLRRLALRTYVAGCTRHRIEAHLCYQCVFTRWLLYASSYEQRYKWQHSEKPGLNNPKTDGRHLKAMIRGKFQNLTCQSPP